MDIIDSHHHFWNYDANDYPWIDDSLAMLKLNYCCDDLLAATEGRGIVGAVSVQARTIAEETDYLLEEGEKCPLVKGVVGWAPLASPDVLGMLEQWKGNSF